MKGIFHGCILVYLFIFIKIQAQENTIGATPDSLKLRLTNSFKIPDSLQGMDYAQLENVFLLNKFNIPKATIYAKSYLAKAKNEQNIAEIAEGYFFMTSVSEKEQDLAYADSIIRITRDFTQSKYPGKGHLLKGNAYYEMEDYNACLEQFLIAADYARKNANEFQYRSIKLNIGVIKTSLGEYEEALDIFRAYVAYLELNQLQGKYPASYNRCLYNLADSYTYMKKNDSANLVIDKGIRVTLQTNDSLIYPYFVLNSGINLYVDAQYERALDSLLKAKKHIEMHSERNDSKFLLLNQYLGKTYEKLNNHDQSIDHYKKVDTLLQTTNDINPELVESYKALIKHSKEIGDDAGRLYYIDALLQYDSILDANYKYLSKKIVKKYEKSELIYQKQQLLEALTTNKKYTGNLVKIILGLIFLSSGVNFYFVRRSRVYKKRFNALLNDQEVRKNEKERMRVPTSINLPEEVLNDIISKLEKFEQSKRFVSTYTMAGLAKELQTNTTYLSKIINTTKQMNFSSYMNDLRIGYAIERLKNDGKFRKYTIKAIAQEVGFNKAQSFSLAFYKKTGIYPSYFIQEIEKQ